MSVYSPVESKELDSVENNITISVGTTISNNGPDPVVSVNCGSSLYYNFLFFCFLYSIAHGTVDAVLAFSSAELGEKVGSEGGFMLYIFYTFSALFIAKPILNKFKSKRTVWLGLLGMLAYVVSFFFGLVSKSLAVIIFPLGGAIGGIGAGILWTGQGSYYSVNSIKYSSYTHSDNKINSTNFSSIFAAIYLSLETSLKLLATVIFLSFNNKQSDTNSLFRSWRMVVFGLYSLAAIISVILFQFLVLNLDDKRNNNIESDITTSTVVNPTSSLIYDSLNEGSHHDEVFTNPPRENRNNMRLLKNSTFIRHPIIAMFLDDSLSVTSSLLSNRLLQLLIPFQITFGLSSGFVGTYVNGVIVKNYIGDGYIGALSGLSTLVAVLASWPFAYISNNFIHGKWFIMVTGGICFIFTGLPVLCIPDNIFGTWLVLIPYFIIHGIGRSVWENINKSIIVDYFTNDKQKSDAFAAIYFSSGLAGAFGFIFFKFMSEYQVALLNYERHIQGKRHADQLLRTASIEVLWKDFTTNAREWSIDCIPNDIASAWSYEELSTDATEEMIVTNNTIDGIESYPYNSTSSQLNLRRSKGRTKFRFRSNCLHPSTVIQDLSPRMKARMWRYLRDAMGFSYYTEIATIMAAIDADSDGHLRIKELFESFETYRIIANFIIATQKTINNRINLDHNSSISSINTISSQNNLNLENIVELACGHGLIGVLLAYRFPHLNVHLYDLYKRPTFEAFIRGFEKYGFKRENSEKVLSNIIFHETDLLQAKDVISNSVVVCVHGCGEVNKQAIELAQSNNACGWIVMPCCINKDMYLGSECSVQLSSDEARHMLMCGALANEYNAQLIASIDNRITNRNIIIGGGVGENFPINKQTENDSEINNSSSLLNIIRRKRMPRLIFS
eukprot:gene4711-6614_t